MGRAVLKDESRLGTHEWESDEISQGTNCDG